MTYKLLMIPLNDTGLAMLLQELVLFLGSALFLGSTNPRSTKAREELYSNLIQLSLQDSYKETTINKYVHDLYYLAATFHQHARKSPVDIYTTSMVYKTCNCHG